MPKSHLSAAALLTASAAGAVTLLLVPIGFVRLSGIIGLALLLVLFSYDDDRTRSVMGSLAFSAVGALSLVIAALPVCQYIFSVPPMDPQLTGKWLPLLWVLGTVVFWVVDRSRVTSPMPATSFRPDPPLRTEHSPPRLVRDEPRPEFRYDATVTQPAVPPVPQPITQPVVQPVAQPLFQGVSQTPVPTPVQPVAPTPVQPPPPAPAPIPVPAGKVATIYVNLIGEGLNVLR